MSESDQQQQMAAAYNYAYNYGIYGSANGQQPNYLGYQQQQGANANSTITAIGTAANAYANSQYSLAATAYAQYGQAAQQQVAAASSAAGYGVHQPTDYSSAGAYGVIGTGKPQGNNRPSQASGSNAVTPHQHHYAGYQAAVYAASNYAPQAQGKTSSGGWQNRGQGGNRHQKKRYGLGHQNRDMQQFFCELCKISCAGQAAYKDHMEGKPHKRKELAGKQETQLQGRGLIAFRCEICGITCSSKDTYDAHVKGQKHQRTVALLRRMGKPVPEMPGYENSSGGMLGADGGTSSLNAISIQQQGRPIPTVGGQGPLKKVVGVTGTKFIGGTTLLTTGEELKTGRSGTGANSVSITGPVRPQDLEKALLGDENVKPIGQEFIEEEKDSNGKFITYVCKLCDCKFSDIGAKDVHLKGRRHRLNYKQKVDPSLKVEMKTQWGKAKVAQQHQHPGAYITAGQAHPIVFQQPRSHFPMQRNQEIMDDKHVLHKLQQIQFTMEEGQRIERLAFFVEKTLKAVSDSMVTSGGWTGDEAEQNRILKGVMRVGVLAKQLMIKSDTQIDLVVLCSKVPTVALLNEVVELFEKKADELNEGEQLTVTNAVDQSGFTVSLGQTPPMNCHVTLTAVTMREQQSATVAVGNANEAAPAANGEKSEEQPAGDPLPREPCLKALAELRRTKFYQVKCYPLHSMHCTVKLVRDICLRVRTWSPLNYWIIELICEKALSSMAMPLSPGDAVRRLFEVMSSGVFLSKRSKLLDPCEKEQIDVMAHITDQEREDITSSSQHALRLISYNQIYKILGIDRLADAFPPPGQPMAFNGFGGGGGPQAPQKQPMKRRADGSSAGADDAIPTNSTNKIEEQNQMRGDQPSAEDPSNAITQAPINTAQIVLGQHEDAPEAKKGKIEEEKMETTAESTN